MKYFIIAICILFGVATGKVDARPCAKCVVGELLEELPTDNPRVLRTQMRRLSLVTEDGIRMIATKFQLPGKGDNSTLEFALTAFVNYVLDKGKDKLTEEAKAAFFNAIPKCRGAENKGFMISLTAQLCNTEDIPRFEQFLENKALAPYAEYAVEYIENPVNH